MRHYQTPQLIYSIFSKENVLTASGETPEPKTDLNEWLGNAGAGNYNNQVVVNMAD
ncbi:MAG: hypothetical protein IJH94_03330 [Clostridia bacterium]|nr:hypothetical protein [Clostridia bacterium]